MSLEKDIESLVKSVGLELYDISTLNDGEDLIYRISIISNEIENEKRKNVSLDECVNLTHLISPLLDVSPPVSGDYRLEVGSPGIERKITTIKQFELSVGEAATIVLKSKEKFKGIVLRVEGSKIFLDANSEEIVVDFSDISKAKTYFEW
ncbi:ribosome maturation factor [Sulfurimonas sp.]|jgi:ribosome maturation factor RimP|uniref:ribosome maturation factor n=1 Tax=Sulfurimonas sp. TaxID=2022749 RepID=UPI0025FFE0F5|nr:ribosome maturation factor [Sulfurimonas sp.]MCK9473587.1 ribosome maturation factor [Sulfurimonas sp.]MDD3505256.1 ribosome maturation factor [Sulfurimonas sp.]